MSATRELKIGPDTPVEINQIEWEFCRALELYRARKPRRVLELGTNAGGSLYHWVQAADPGAHVVTVDVNPLPDADCFHGPATWEQVVGDSHADGTAAEVAKRGPFDWLFIDACHVYEDARDDWNTFTPMCAPTGVVLLHDISLVRDYPETGQTAGVWRLWREIQAAGHLTQEFRAQPGFPEYGIGVVYL